MVRAKTGRVGAIAAVVVILLGTLFMGHLAGSITAAPLRAETEVEVDDNYFEPKSLTIAVGTTVTWANEGQREHTVTADTGAFASDDLEHDGAFSYTFSTAGTFAYYCKYHGGPGGTGMAGTIVVTAAGAGPSTLPTTGAPHQSIALLLTLVVGLGVLGAAVRARSSVAREQ